MITVLLSILKIIGIVLLCILALIVTVLILVLFVPVRYQVKGYRKEGDEVPVRAAVKITWLLHILNAAFRYPEEPYIKVRIFCFTVFSTRKKEVPEEEKQEEKTGTEAEDKKKQDDAGKQEREGNIAENNASATNEAAEQKETVDIQAPDGHDKKTESEAGENDGNEKEPTILRFIQKLAAILKNIKYTICKICDKIKEIIQNIKYYIKIIQSDSFQRAFQMCRGEALKLIKSVLPGRITGDFVIGLGDPASTAQILSVQGILYPIIGNYISITPDFERSVFEGDFFIKGKITAFRILKTAVKVYFNKDMRKVIRLFKKGGSINGR